MFRPAVAGIRPKYSRDWYFLLPGRGGIGVPRRIKAWEDEYNQGEKLQNLYVINQPVYLVNESSVQQLINTIKATSRERGIEASLIVVDTLARCFAGADENSTRDMNNFIAGCDRIKAATRATVMVVHHTGKDIEKGARGSSALRAASDFEYAVKRTDDGGAFILSCTKSKDDREPEAQLFNLKSRTIFVDEEGDEVTSLTSEKEGIPLPGEYDTPPKGKNVTANHIAVWQSVRSRLAKDEPTTRAMIKDDLIAMEFDKDLVRKKLGGWIKKLIDDGCLMEREGSYYPTDSEFEGC
ncbi:AAA family ATPase [Endozoicomonas sp.]|uniref:AAA family ATPase n=1 Tax=Endozoicomonas sp. TaxID=1892382 RepID=UPI00383AC1C8